MFRIHKLIFRLTKRYLSFELILLSPFYRNFTVMKNKEQFWNMQTGQFAFLYRLRILSYFFMVCVSEEMLQGFKFASQNDKNISSDIICDVNRLYNSIFGTLYVPSRI